MEEIFEVVAEGSPKAAMRRRQVLDAAGQCFRDHGFHGCSMAQIAAQSGMSVGHIYRYFAGKDEIIEAIVQRKLDGVTSRFAELERTPGNLYQALLAEVEFGVAVASDPEHAALMVEIRAEAGRNPATAATVRAADRTLREHLARVFARAGASRWSSVDVEARVEMLALIFEGISQRMIVNPALDRTSLIAMIRRTIEALFAPEA